MHVNLDTLPADCVALIASSITVDTKAEAVKNIRALSSTNKRLHAALNSERAVSIMAHSFAQRITARTYLGGMITWNIHSFVFVEALNTPSAHTWLRKQPEYQLFTVVQTLYALSQEPHADTHRLAEIKSDCKRHVMHNPSFDYCCPTENGLHLNIRGALDRLHTPWGEVNLELGAENYFASLARVQLFLKRVTVKLINRNPDFLKLLISRPDLSKFSAHAEICKPIDPEFLSAGITSEQARKYDSSIRKTFPVQDLETYFGTPSFIIDGPPDQSYTQSLNRKNYGGLVYEITHVDGVLLPQAARHNGSPAWQDYERANEAWCAMSRFYKEEINRLKS